MSRDQGLHVVDRPICNPLILILRYPLFTQHKSESQPNYLRKRHLRNDPKRFGTLPTSRILFRDVIDPTDHDPVHDGPSRIGHRSDGLISKKVEPHVSGNISGLYGTFSSSSMWSSLCSFHVCRRDRCNRLTLFRHSSLSFRLAFLLVAS